MKRIPLCVIASILSWILQSTNGAIVAWPFDGKNFTGRIAFSSDGNFNDEDDWGAFPVAVAILHEFGVKDRLVHVDYNNILTENDPRFYREMTASVLGSVERYDLPQEILFDCQMDLEGAIESIKNAINASSAEDPLYLVLAGPMEVPYRGIDRSDPGKRKFVYCISHSGWNDGYSRDMDLYTHNKRDVIPSGINWIQIRDGNRNLAHPGGPGKSSTASQWRLYRWFKNAEDPNLRWMYTRMEAELRADISDACMTYFLLTGEEDLNLDKLKRILVDHEVPKPFSPRPTIRIEAENFRTLTHAEVEFKNERAASKRMSVILPAGRSGSIETLFHEPYSASSNHYDVGVRYFDAQDGKSEYALYINGTQQGPSWKADSNNNFWLTRVFENIPINRGDSIKVTAKSNGNETAKLDHIQLHIRNDVSVSLSATSNLVHLDDPAAMPGQIIVAGPKPGYLKYNGGGPVFLSGPDNPETFLYDGPLNPDGTRSGEIQKQVIDRLIASGVNAFHCQMFRMQVCNNKREGDDQHCPFLYHDPAMPLNEAVLGQWDGWFDLLEANGIALHLEFYNDATDVEGMGWKLDDEGNLHPDEDRWIRGIVNRFKHHKNILWGIEESCNKLPASRTRHFKKIAEVIAETDNFNHPIVQSFVIPNDPEGDNHPDDVVAADYAGDPHINVVTWLHVQPNKEDIEAQHQEYLQYYHLSANDFVVMKNETFHHPRSGAISRQYMWSCAMAGLHSLEAYHGVTGSSYKADTLADDGRLNHFMEQTDFYTMKPSDHLAAASTKWVLANPGHSYIAYTYDYSGSMEIKDMTPETYNLLWFDPIDGDTIHQRGVEVTSSNPRWKKPAAIGDEVALYIQKTE